MLFVMLSSANDPLWWCSEKTVEHLLSNAMKALRGHRTDIYRIVLIVC